ncbi:MAG: hypothetical protein QMC23_05235 [Rubritalea sp.]|jgi:hypothetical protein|tara:strand:+ start:10631 stop:10846 length:216 start_codon:yes stop_codon:yes gene_type:complete
MSHKQSALFRGHFGVELEEFFQSLGIVLEAATDVDPLQGLIIPLESLAQIFRQGLWFIQIRDCRRKVCLAG